MSEEIISVGIIGAGPAGIAAAVECKVNGINNVVIFEKASKPCATLRRLYPAGKRVDKTYKGITLEAEGVCNFETETKEEFLKRMNDYISKYALKIEFEVEINGLRKEENFYILKAGTCEIAKANAVIIATGVFDRPKRPSYPIPKEVQDRVFFEIPGEIPEKEKVLVVGGGNTAAELACLLAGKCDVKMAYRRPQFFRINEENLKELEKRKEQITFYLGRDIVGLEPEKDGVKAVFQDGHREIFSKIFYCLGGSTPKVFLERMGIDFKNNSPIIDEFGESNLERVFLIGDVAVKSGSIMYAFNSAHRAVKRLLEKYPDIN